MSRDPRNLSEIFERIDPAEFRADFAARHIGPSRQKVTIDSLASVRRSDVLIACAVTCLIFILCVAAGFVAAWMVHHVRII